MAYLKRPASLLATAAGVLASAVGLDLSCREGQARGPATPAPRVVYALDQESSAPLLVPGRFETERFVTSLIVADLGVRNLVLSARVISRELDRVEKGAPPNDPDARGKAKKDHLGKIVDAAKKAGIRLTRLAIVPGPGEPLLASGDPARQKAAVERHAEIIQCAAELGCPRISLVLATTGFYDEQKVKAVEGMLMLREALKARKLEAIPILISSGPGLSANGVWLRQVLDDLLARKVENVGLLLDCGAFDYSPRTALDELTGRDPVTRRPPESEPVASADRARNVKAIVVDASDAPGGGVELPGLGINLTRELLAGIDFEGEISVRYRGRYQSGFRESLKALANHFGPEIPTPTLASPSPGNNSPTPVTSTPPAVSPPLVTPAAGTPPAGTPPAVLPGAGAPPAGAPPAGGVTVTPPRSPAIPR